MVDAGEMSRERDRAKNFSVDEDRVLRENYAKHKDILTSAQSNKVTNKMKNGVWKSIAASVSALGHENRDANACKIRWKNLSSTAKRAFNEYRYSQKVTGGGTPPKSPSAAVISTIELMKDTAKFKGVDGGISTFHVPTPPNVSLSESFLDGTEEQENATSPRPRTLARPVPTTKNPLQLLSDLAKLEEPETSSKGMDQQKTGNSTISDPSSTSASTKRKHYETTAEVQMRVLKKEEDLQKKKELLLDVRLRTALIEEEVANLKKKKLEIELAKMNTDQEAAQLVPQIQYLSDTQQLVDYLNNENNQLCQ